MHLFIQELFSISWALNMLSFDLHDCQKSNMVLNNLRNLWRNVIFKYQRNQNRLKYHDLLKYLYSKLFRAEINAKIGDLYVYFWEFITYNLKYSIHWVEILPSGLNSEFHNCLSFGFQEQPK